MANDHYGIYRAEVLNTADPLNQGRVQLMVPSLIRTVSGWAAPCLSPGASTASIKVGDAVWVMFESGDPNSPVFMGMRPA